MRDTIIIFACLVIGGVVGYVSGIPEWLPHDLSPYMGNVPSWIPKDMTSILICILMIVIGMDLGNDSERLKTLTQLPVSYFLLPILTVIGSLLGAGVMSFVFPDMKFAEGMAVGAGLGYYSVSSIIISSEITAELGFIALFSNVFRETITMLLSPFLAKFFGPLAPIASGGANAADVTLPIILKASGQEYMLPALLQGFVCMILVPIVVGLCCTLA